MVVVDYEKELNKEQLSVVFSNNKHSLVLAGPGSGKTRVIVYRIYYLINNGVSPENILLLTFTNKAAKNMINKTRELLDYHPNGIFAGTFHHVANIMLRRHSQVFDFDSNFSIIDSEDCRHMIKNIINSFNLPNKKSFPSPSVILSVNSFAKNSLITTDECINSRYSHLDKFRDNILKICSIYDSNKKKQNVVDFDDLLYYWNKILDNKNIRDHYCRQFTNILIDEFQDTNKLQFEIIKKLSNNDNNVLVVGDDCQSIYSFRAAEIKNILDFPKFFPDYKEFKLVKNYRSTPQILNLVNNSIKNNKNRFDKTLSTDNKSNFSPFVVECDNLDDEAKFVVNKIIELKKKNDCDDFAVLFRADYHSANIELELIKKGISFKKVGGLKFFEQSHIKDISALLKIFINTKDEISWNRILSLFDGIGPGMSYKIYNYLLRFENPFSEIIKPLDIKFSDRSKSGWNDFINVIRSCYNKNKPSEIIDIFLKEFYNNYLKNKYPNFKDRVFDVKQFIDLAIKYNDIKSFINDITLDVDLTNSESGINDNSIVLSTIHQAKGLEWDAVFVVSLAENRFPISIAYENDNIEEERRLFYVACSRAKNFLYLTFPLEEFTYWGGYNSLDESTFISELPKNCYKTLKS